MLTITELEEEILSHYGLPFTFEFSDVLQELGVNNKFDLAGIATYIEKLEQTAKGYFNRDILTDIRLLERAQQLQIEIDCVLPELTLKLYAEPYYDFCYYFLFLKNEITPQDFLDELKLVTTINCSNKLSELVNGGFISTMHKNCNDLKNTSLRFIDTFLQNYNYFNDNRSDYIADGLPF